MRIGGWVRTAVLGAVWCGGVMAWPGVALAAPAIAHNPARTAVRGQSMGVRAMVQDPAARVVSASLFYAASRGTTPFRVAMSSTGAGVWFGTIPGHMIGPGEELFYYIQAENADGETRETDWFPVRVGDRGVSPEDIPTAGAVARQAQRDAVPVTAARPGSSGAQGAAQGTTQAQAGGRSKYLVPAAVIAGGAVAIGGAIALVDSGGGGGGGGGGSITNANYGGTYQVCFEPSGTVSNLVTECDSGLVNVYVKDGTVQVVGLWGGEVLSTRASGTTFSASGTVVAQGAFPAAYLIVTGEAGASSCTATVNGYSTDSERPGNFTGRLDTTLR